MRLRLTIYPRNRSLHLLIFHCLTQWKIIQIKEAHLHHFDFCFGFFSLFLIFTFVLRNSLSELLLKLFFLLSFSKFRLKLLWFFLLFYIFGFFFNDEVVKVFKEEGSRRGKGNWKLMIAIGTYPSR